MRMRDKVSTAFWLSVIIMCFVFVFYVSIDKNEQSDIQLISKQMDQYVYDDEACLSIHTIQVLNEDLKRLEEITGIQYFVVSTASYGAHVIEDYSYTIYQDMITSGKPTILLLFSKTQKDMILRSEKKWKEVLNPYFISNITDDIFDPYLADNQINDAVLETVETSLLPIAKEYQIEVSEIISGEVSKEGYAGFQNSIIVNWISAGFIFLFFVVVVVGLVAIAIFLIFIYYSSKEENIMKQKDKRE